MIPCEQVTAGRKNSFLTGRNIQEEPGSGTRKPRFWEWSALLGWGLYDTAWPDKSRSCTKQRVSTGCLFLVRLLDASLSCILSYSVAHCLACDHKNSWDHLWRTVTFVPRKIKASCLLSQQETGGFNLCSIITICSTCSASFPTDYCEMEGIKNTEQ